MHHITSETEHRGNIDSCSDLLLKCQVGEKMHRNTTVGVDQKTPLNNFFNFAIKVSLVNLFLLISFDIIKLLNSYQLREDSASLWEELMERYFDVPLFLL